MAAVELTKAWLENLPADIEEPTEAEFHPPRKSESRTSQNEEYRIRPSPTSPRYTMSGRANYSTSKVQTPSLTSSKPGAMQFRFEIGKSASSVNSDGASTDLDLAFNKLVGNFPAPREASVKSARAEKVKDECSSLPHDVEDDDDVRKVPSSWNKAHTCHDDSPSLGWNHLNVHRKHSTDGGTGTQEMETLEKQSKDYRNWHDHSDDRDALALTILQKPSDNKTFELQGSCKTDVIPILYPAAHKADVSEQRERKKLPRSCLESSIVRQGHRSGRDFATQTFGQVLTSAALTSAEAQTEDISAVEDETLTEQLTDIKESVDKYFRQLSLEVVRRCAAASSRDGKVGEGSTTSERFGVSKNPIKTNEREEEGFVLPLDQLSVETSNNCWAKRSHTKANPHAAEIDSRELQTGDVQIHDAESARSTSESSAIGNNQRVMKLMLEEVKALKSFVQERLEERQTDERGMRRGRIAEEEKDPDSDSALGLAMTDTLDRKRHSEKQKHHKSRRKSRSRSGAHHILQKRLDDDEEASEDRHKRRTRYQRRLSGQGKKDSFDHYNGHEDTAADFRRQYLPTTESRDQEESRGFVPVKGYNYPPYRMQNYYHSLHPSAGLNPNYYPDSLQTYQNRMPAPTALFSRSSGLPYWHMGDPVYHFNYLPPNQRWRTAVPSNLSVQSHNHRLHNPIVPTVDPPAVYQPGVRRVTFVPTTWLPMGQTIQTPQGVWHNAGQSGLNDRRVYSIPDPHEVAADRQKKVRTRSRTDSCSSTQYSNLSHGPSKLKNSLDDALREAKEIRNLTERLERDSQQFSSVYKY